MDRWNGIGEPDDLPEPPLERDPDELGERPVYKHVAISREQIEAVIRSNLTKELT